MSLFHGIQVTSLDGSALLLDRFIDQVVLVVNVASQCGLTPQYEGLERLQQRFGARGFTVLGVPCNQFAGQEPGTEAEIAAFCTTRYDVTFPLTAKSGVNGEARDALYAFLAGPGAAFPGDITWNFEKFLVGKDGQVLARFSPRTLPEAPEVLSAIERALLA
jgi:glutathione peroxidase